MGRMKELENSELERVCRPYMFYEEGALKKFIKYIGKNL